MFGSREPAISNVLLLVCLGVGFSLLAGGAIPDFGYCTTEKCETTTGVRPIGLGVGRQAQSTVFVLYRALTPPSGDYRNGPVFLLAVGRKATI